MTTDTPLPFPEAGQRGLTPKETMQRAKAIACTLPKDNKPTCSGQIFVGLFFDGTGNNRDKDYVKLPLEERKHSNIVRLFHVFPEPEIKSGHYPIYIPGVGTPFPKIGDSGKSWSATAGSAAAWKGEDRIVWGLIQLLNAPHRFVHNDAQLIPPGNDKLIVGNTSSSGTPGFWRRQILNTWQEKLKTALEGKKLRVEQINVSVFGFSRGAAEARTFVNWLFEICKPEGGGWTLAGVPLRLQFLGIFDTVASVGAANLSDTGTLAGHQSWADNTQEIHPAVERCVHFVAGHEVRACFPLDSVRVKSKYPGNAHEVMYPGSHSDVGGGYAPGDLGVSLTPDSMLSIIPGFNMYKEALKSGVPLLAFKDLDPVFQRDLTPSDDVIRDFNAYLRAAKVEAASVEKMGRKHMAYYFSYRFKHRAAFYQRRPFAAAPPTEQKYLRVTQETLIRLLEFIKMGSLESLPPNDPSKNIYWTIPNAWRDDVMAPDFDPPKVVALFEKNWRKNGVLLDKNQVEVARRIDIHTLTPDIENFFDRYIHDSMAGFIGMGMDEYKFNGIGFVKFRTVFKGND